MAVGMEEFFKRWARQRGVMMAEAFAARMRLNVGKQAATRRTASGRLVAIFPARPGAYPRRVSGALQKSIRVVKTAKGAKVRVGNAKVPYATALEYGKGGHAFFYRTMKEMKLLK